MTEPRFNSFTEEEWYHTLTGDHPSLRRGRRLFGVLPTNPRCKVCYAPFSGVGGVAMRLIGRGPFEKNPNFCSACVTTTRDVGVEIEISMLFADVRGSTSLAEGMSPARFTQLMNRFFDAAMRVLIENDAWVDRLVGDEVVSLFIPGYAGQEHSQKAIRAGRGLLEATGHASKAGPWLPVGVGVHTGIAYVGLVGSEGGVSDLTAMGDAMNITARLTSLAGAGEVLISDAACAAADMDTHELEHRRLDLKGREEPVDVHVLHVGAS